MIRLVTKGHNDMCGGYGYSGFALFEGHTIREALEEIKEFSQDGGAYLGEGFGNPKYGNGHAWKITINGMQYLSSWSSPNWGGYIDNINYYLDKKVKGIKVSGGWYCFYDFDIITE